MLNIPKENFREVELDKDIEVDKKYDMAISLEVAEHLPEKSAKSFVHALTRASDIILFSAAVPLQGGTNHINEQWPNYWWSLFKEHGFVAIDFLRKQIWDEEKVAFWYRQNIILYVKKEILSTIKIGPSDICRDKPPISIIHPELWFNATHIFAKRYILPIVAPILGNKFGNMIRSKILSKTTNHDETKPIYGTGEKNE
jgi:hypothetical protein